MTTGIMLSNKVIGAIFFFLKGLGELHISMELGPFLVMNHGQIQNNHFKDLF